MAENNQMTLDYGEEFHSQLSDDSKKVKLRPSPKIKSIIKASVNLPESKEFQSNFEVGNIIEDGLLPPPLKCPEGYTITAEDGVKYYGDGEAMTISVTPFFLGKKLTNVDNKNIEYDICAYDDSSKKIISLGVLSAVDIGNNKIIELANKGLDITKLNEKSCIRYIQNFRNENRDKIPVAKKYSRTGWHEGKFVYPPSNGEYVIEGKNLERIYSTRGTEKDWLDGIEKIINFKFVKLGLALGFFAPLIEILNLPNTLVQFRGRSMSGKTILLLIISSIYGDPKHYMQNFNAAQKAIEGLALEFNDLPFVIDEFQITSRKEIKGLAYTIFEGTSRARSSASGIVNATKNFRTITIMSGETNFTSSNAPMGAKRRCIGIGDDNIIPSEIAVDMQNLVKNNHGVIGREWVKYVENHQEIFCEEYEKLKNNETLKKAYENKLPEHFNLVVAAFTAFKIFRREFYHIQEFEAETEALKSVLELVEDFPNVVDLKNTSRALDVVRDYFDKYASYFIEESVEHNLSPNQIKGYLKILKGEKYIGFLKADILKLLESKNFDSSILREFKEEDTIIVDNNHKNRFTKTIRFNGLVMTLVLFREGKLKQTADDE